MKLRLIAFFVLLASTSFAQQAAADATQLSETRRARAELAADIAAGRREPVAALLLLKQRRMFLATDGDADTDQGLAAADIGQRLLVSRAPEKANGFFRAAEGFLGLGIARTADPAAKAQLLVRRAQIRSQHLAKKAEAAADMAQAASLQPNDPYIKSWRELLARRDALVLQSQAAR